MGYAELPPRGMHEGVDRSFHPVLYCPTTRLQQKGAGLGAQAGEARIRDVTRQGGFTRFSRASQTPFSLVFDARP